MTTKSLPIGKDRHYKVCRKDFIYVKCRSFESQSLSVRGQQHVVVLPLIICTRCRFLRRYSYIATANTSYLTLLHRSCDKRIARPKWCQLGLAVASDWPQKFLRAAADQGDPCPLAVLRCLPMHATVVCFAALEQTHTYFDNSRVLHIPIVPLSNLYTTSKLRASEDNAPDSQCKVFFASYSTG